MFSAPLGFLSSLRDDRPRNRKASPVNPTLTVRQIRRFESHGVYVKPRMDVGEGLLRIRLRHGPGKRRQRGCLLQDQLTLLARMCARQFDELRSRSRVNEGARVI